MPSLSRELRRLLERTIAGKDGARQIAEDGAGESLRRLAVDRHEPHGSLTTEERTLRNQLRAHGRQLGDKLDPQRGSQTISHLKQAVAYEHWHRLLFARFLAENDLLLHPDHGVALSLNEVKELALGSGRDWIELASDYAQRMLLREVFRSDDPALRVPLSPEKRRDLEAKLNMLPREIFLADDSLGWVYQFWQKDAKDAVNLSEVKIGADELAPLTQLFTEDYMVLFLLENTLGAWWTARRGVPDLLGYTWTYLRLNDDGTPATGAYDGWPKSAKELKVLDPCMGSGHFLVFALPILARMRMEEEGLSLQQSLSEVLKENLFGLEIDARCAQIAAFNLALTAWKLAGSHFELPPLHLACSGLGINAKEEDWVKLADDNGPAAEALRRVYSLFRDAPTLGSLIDPLRLKANVYAAGTEHVLPMLEEALKNEEANEDSRELAIAAQGLLAAFRILARQFTLVLTNVPYLGRTRQCPLLAQYCTEFHKEAKADLATCFVDRCLRFCVPGGTTLLVTPQNWLFLTSYAKFRGRLLDGVEWNLVSRLGPHAFETIGGEVVNVALLGLTRRKPSDEHAFSGWDVGDAPTPADKAKGLQAGPMVVTQAAQLTIPTWRITFEVSSGKDLLRKYVKSHLGICTGDFSRFGRVFWELSQINDEWAWQQSSVENTTPAGGLSGILLWQKGRGDLYDYLCERLGPEGVYAWIRGEEAWGHRGVLMTASNRLSATRYFGHLFDNNVTVLTVEDEALLPAVWAFCEGGELGREVRKFNQKLSITDQSFVEVPFDLAHWQSVAAKRYPNGLPTPYSADPTQWLFNGNPTGSSHPLQVAVARLVGYGWPRQMGSSFPDCPALGPDGTEGHVATDGIVCLSSVAGEENAGVRLRALLQASFGFNYNLTDLLTGRKAATLDAWLRDEFFEEHCQIFHQRPFVWHIWDGLKDGFHALVNYHKLDRRNLEKLIFSYLGDWLTRQRQDVQNGVEGADTRLAAAEHLQGELKKILEGKEPYDIFVRWKPLDKQAIGWEPDLSDGVRMNIRPWITEAKLYKATKPGILRVTPNIKYTKDRGKEPARDPKEFPWFAKSTDRVNDVHLSLDEKRRARGLQ
jgi:hypothetical protein